MADVNISNQLNDFISFLQGQNKSTHTIVAYKKDLLQLVDFLAKVGKTDASAVTTADLEAFINSLTEKQYRAKSVARKLNAIKGFFRWARQKSLISTDPAIPVPHPKYELGLPRVLSTLEYRALRDAARRDPRTRAIIELLLQTGMRISDLAALALENIKKTEVVVDGRSIPLGNAAKSALDEYLKNRQETAQKNVFVTKTGRPLLVRNIRASIERCFTEAGIENATVNDLRNTFIVHQLEAGVDLVTISRIVGHKRLATTERYLELVSKNSGKKSDKIREL
ncbi:tyrosine-type recombinase/integrase [Candidatus Microgenomates bacterium]|nr:tyrosine-type recombinase/integrase [Candidatus Microgenomates bacterium]